MEDPAIHERTALVGKRSVSLCSSVACEDARQARKELSYEWHLRWAFRLSWLVNWLLLGLKIYAFSVSRSKAVLASMADSAVDLASQMVLSVAECQMSRYHPGFPIGRGRLEALAVIACACIMSISCLEVVQFAAADLYAGFATGELPELDLSLLMFVILGSGTVMKLLLYVYCNWLKSRSDSMEALAEDHINDVASNMAAIIAALVTKHWQAGWWVDPVAATAMSLIILGRWCFITHSQVLKLVGQAAPEEFVSLVEGIAKEHHPQLLVDVTRAYSFGARFNVEMEVVLPADMSVAESHDIALDLQHKIEGMDEVERAFVHVDYMQRPLPEHKVERNLWLNHCSDKAARQASTTAAVTANGTSGGLRAAESPV